jgi:hypothetical protein
VLYITFSNHGALESDLARFLLQVG